MPDYTEAGGQPWEKANLSAVYIADGVTSIGDYAFDGINNLTTVEIQNPAALTSVGDYAFRGCDRLQGTEDHPLDLSGVTDLGMYAFSGCERLGLCDAKR